MFQIRSCLCKSGFCPGLLKLDYCSDSLSAFARLSFLVFEVLRLALKRVKSFDNAPRQRWNQTLTASFPKQYLFGIVMFLSLNVCGFFFSWQEITLTEKSQMFESWKNPPPPVYMEYYFFNVTNPEEFLAGGKASVKQIGPYTYRYVSQPVTEIYINLFLSFFFFLTKHNPHPEEMSEKGSDTNFSNNHFITNLFRQYFAGVKIIRM